MAKAWPIVLWAAVALVALLFLYHVRAILFPFVSAVFLALLLNPWIAHLQKRRGYSRPQAVVLVYILFLLVVLVPALWLWRPLTVQAANLTRSLPQTFKNAQVSLRAFLLERPVLVERYKMPVPLPTPRSGPPAPEEVLRSLPRSERGPERDLAQRTATRLETTEEAVDRLMARYLGQVTDRIQTIGPTLLNGVLSSGASVLGQLLNLILIPIITFFLLIDLERFKQGAVFLVPYSFRKPVVDTLEDIGEVFLKYIRGLVTAAIIYAIVATIEFSLLGLPYALVLGLLAGLLYFIPYVGPLVTVSLVAATAAMTPSPHYVLFILEFSSPVAYTILVTLVALIIYFVFDQLVTPRVVGGAVGLHPVFSFFAIMSGATLFGIPGMLLAYPVAGSIKVVLARILPLILAADEAASRRARNERPAQEQEPPTHAGV